jgi:ubiquinone/menaquinone biosynthesis C-methylase UbiE
VKDATTLQRDYYAATAANYEDMHFGGAHDVALFWLSGLIRLNAFESLLDVGSGTGRCLRFLKEERLPLTLVGVEPVGELRAIGKQRGLSEIELIEGDALNLPFADRTFDVVCCFGVLHHIKDHRRAVTEMCRVARHAVFISDANNFGQGSPMARLLKQALNSAKLWGLLDLVRTRGKGYHYSVGDGVFFSYSIFNDVPVLRKKFSELQFMSTQPSGENLYRTAPHLAVFAKSPT